MCAAWTWPIPLKTWVAPARRSPSSKLIAAIKNAKLKVESQINGDKLRISGKKRDDLQTAIALLKKTDVDLPLQFENFRD
jgi:uncharacterized protein YajQ (UPF0234 family)